MVKISARARDNGGRFKKKERTEQIEKSLIKNSENQSGAVSPKHCMIMK